MKQTIFPVILVAAFLFFSCTKQQNPERQPGSNCRLMTTYLFEEGAVKDSFRYHYNEQNQVETVKGNRFAYSLEYEAGKVVRRILKYPTTMQPFAKDSVLYNGNGTIHRIERVGLFSEMVQTTEFAYQHNKQTSITFYDSTGKLGARYDYTYTINNITTVNAQELWNGLPRNYQIDFAYDTAGNDVSQGHQALLINGFLSNHIGMGVIYALSDNHVKSTAQEGITFPVQFGMNEYEKVTEIMVGNAPLMQATYECR